MTSSAEGPIGETFLMEKGPIGPTGETGPTRFDGEVIIVDGKFESLSDMWRRTLNIVGEGPVGQEIVIERKLQGPTGATGTQGSTGCIGSRGPQGSRGCIGSMGPRGETKWNKSE
jgi:hypothetical protein